MKYENHYRVTARRGRESERERKREYENHPRETV